MRTFTEERGVRPFNWFEELAKDKERTHSNWYNLRERSGNWVTCACGNLCDIIPRFSITGEPKDDTLRLLGIDFHQCIKDRNATGALIVLHAIEERSTEIIKEITGIK